MDIGYTYASQAWERAAIYAPPGYQPPETIDLTHEGAAVEFIRVSDRSLECGPTYEHKKPCTNYECHRRELGKCQCGRHPDGVRISRAVPA